MDSAPANLGMNRDELSQNNSIISLRSENVNNDALLPTPKKDGKAALPIEMQPCYDPIFSEDVRLQLDGVTMLRKATSVESNPQTSSVTESGLLSRLAELLRSDTDRLLLECLWVLTNVAATHDASSLLKAGAIDEAIKLLDTRRDKSVLEQAIWFLGNIAVSNRDDALGRGAMTAILRIAATHTQEPVSLLRKAAWAIANMCAGKPAPSFDSVSAAIPTLTQLIYSTDEEVITEALWALSFVSDGPNVQTVIESGCARRLVDLVSHSSINVVFPALRTVGHIVTGDDMQTQLILNCGLLTHFSNLLDSTDKDIRHKACWTLANITAGNSLQIQSVIEANLFPAVMNLAQNSDLDVRKEAVWCLYNATCAVTLEQLQFLIKLGLIRTLCDNLVHTDASVLTLVLEGLLNVLLRFRSSGENLAAHLIEEASGLDKIEGLRTQNPNYEVYERCVAILDFFPAPEDTDQLAV